MTKNPKLSNFQKFHAIFLESSEDFMDYNVENGHQSEDLLSSSVL